MTPRFGNSPEPGRNYVARPGVYAILPGRRGLLVTHQSRPEPEFQLPGGGIDPGESPLRALHREVREETGWRIARPLRLGAFRRFTFMPDYDIWAEKLCTVYVAMPVRGTGAPEEPHHSAHWLSPELALDLLGNDGDRHFLRHFLRRAGRYPGRPNSSSAAETSSLSWPESAMSSARRQNMS